MGNEIQLISDGEGLAVIGNPTDVERFLSSEGLASRDLGLPRLRAVLELGAKAAEAGSVLAENSGRWVKLTKESAEAVKKYGLMETKTRGVVHAMVGKPGEVKRWLQFVKTPTAVLTNPAMLAGVAGIMSQQAMQQQMEAITEYLEAIDEKLDTVLRNQTSLVLSRMDGVDLALREALSVRESVGRVSEITWSKLQTSSTTIHETQMYALRQLGDLAEKLENKSKLDELDESVAEVKAEVQKWLSALARCCQLHDAVAVVELDRVLDASPGEVDRHRLGLKAAREERLALISRSTERLLERMLAAAGIANSKVLLHPSKAPEVVESANQVAISVNDFHGVLGIEADDQSAEAKRWKEAASEKWSQARDTGADGVDAVRRLSSESLVQAKSVKDKVSSKIAERRLRQAEGGAGHDE